MNLMTKEQALALCDQVAETGKVLDEQIQNAATVACGYSVVHGDDSIAARLVAVFPAGSRKASVVAFMEANGNLIWNKETKAMEFFKNTELTPILNDLPALLLRCSAEPWHKYGPKSEPVSQYDVQEMVAALLKKLNKASKREGVTIEGLQYMPILREIVKGGEITLTETTQVPATE